MRADTPKLVAIAAVLVIAICAIISTVILLEMNARVKHLFNVTAKPHCYLSPSYPLRRAIESEWRKEPSAEGTCDDDESRNPD